MNKLILIAVVSAVVIGMGFWLLGGKLLGNNQPKEVSLTYWGLFDDEAMVKPLIDDYHLLHPNVRIVYVKENLTNYRARLQTRLEAGEGADLFWIHNSWLPMLISDVAPAPGNISKYSDFQKNYYPVALASLTAANQVYALPIEIDGLALYYNEDIIKAGGVNPVQIQTWKDFMEAAKKVTVPGEYGQIQTSGAAMGTSDNINHWSEILGTLFLQQPQVTLTSPANDYGGEVIRFYTQFVMNPQNKTWDVTLPSSLKMFSDGKLAFYFGTARDANLIRQANKDLVFKTIPMPRLPEGQLLSWASFWAVAVSNKSSHQTEAWEFANYLSSPRALQLMAAYKNQTGSFAQPYPRIEMAGLLAGDPVLNTFVYQGPYYKSWYLNSETGDAGLNDEIVSAYAKAVKSTLGGADPKGVLAEASQEANKTLVKYFPGSVSPTVSEGIR